MGFKKGDKVSVFLNWDKRGTVYAIQAEVASCGKKQMILLMPARWGEVGMVYAKELFRPEYSEEVNMFTEGYQVTKRLEGEELEAMGLKLAQNFIDSVRAAVAARPAGNGAYLLNELHEPRFFVHRYSA